MSALSEREEMLQTVLARLNELYEEKFYESLDVDTLRAESSLSRPEFRSALAPLYANDWIEDEIQSAANYFTIRLTVSGKERYDQQTGNTANDRVRQQLLALLAATYERNADAMTDSEVLANELGLARNAVCLNLLILERHGLVELQQLQGVGHAMYSVWLTAKGKFTHDNPEPNVLFLSHAAADKEIAEHLKQTIQDFFPRIDVFVSSDPEDLPPGNPWVQTVLANLKAAKMLLILATERGLNRKWVWFETGAGWSRGLQFIPCCVGKIRKGQLPHPFSGYQALNLDEEGDLRILIDELKKQFGAPHKAPDLPKVISELIRLDVRAEEREKTRAAALAADADHTAVRALIMELEDNANAATRPQIDHAYVRPSNDEWLKYRTSLGALPDELRAELNTTYQKVREWKGVVETGINPGIGSMGIATTCQQLRAELPPLIEQLKRFLAE